MNPGPANVLSCPFCGGKKEVMSLISGNTCGATVWSDTRRDYPMLPEVSSIQKCPHCGKYYFIDQASSHYSDDPESWRRSFMELGKLSYSELIEAKQQFDAMSLCKLQRWIINHQLFMAYNDLFRRNPQDPESTPTDFDKKIYAQAIAELLDGIDQSEEYELFHAELLRETGRFDEATEILLQHDAENDRWVVDAMLRHIKEMDTDPFLLINHGEIINELNAN